MTIGDAGMTARGRAESGERESARRPARSRVGLGRGCLAAFLLGVANGCYSYVPINSPPAAGTTVSFVVTDAGRVTLGPTVGSGAEQIEGVLEEQNDSAYVLRMRNVTYINGQSNQWTNERIVVGKQYVTNAKERRFSRSRTALAGAAAVVGVLAFIATRALLGSGVETEKGPGGGGEPQ